ncbi:MAG: REP-associated tyrosine transposase [Eubacteriaceae bacterium]|nr:REP-associated tyrosine transposase [Eubacteriaceae bacterium]
MGRRPRIEFQGAVYHVIKRGNNREFIFQHQEDKVDFLRCLEAAKESYHFKLLGYVIMDNHYHLIIETQETPLNKIMQKINNAYSKSYNKRYQRSDHVFGGRYKGILVNDDSYLLTLLRYLHTNPVRAKITPNVDLYEWSSDHFYRRNLTGQVEIDTILNMFSENRQIAIVEYKKFIAQKDLIDNPMEFFEMASMIGNDEKTSANQSGSRRRETLDQILERVSDCEEVFRLIKSGSRQRTLSIYKISYVKEAVDLGYTLKEIGDNINLSATAVNRMSVNRFEVVKDNGEKDDL